jgi:hypothetical protein
MLLCPLHITWPGLGLNTSFHSERPAFQFVIRGCLSFHPYVSTHFYVLYNTCGFSRGVLKYIYKISLLASFLTAILYALVKYKFSKGLFCGLVEGKTGPMLRHHTVKICQGMKFKTSLFLFPESLEEFAL